MIGAEHNEGMEFTTVIPRIMKTISKGVVFIISPRIIRFADNLEWVCLVHFSVNRLRDTRDRIAVGQQGRVLFLLVEPQGCFNESPSP